MAGAGKNRLVTVVPGRVVPVKVAPGMPGRGLAPPEMAPRERVVPEMAAVSRFAVRQAAPGMRFAQAVGANAVPLSGAAAMASVPTGIAPPAVMLPVIGCTEPAAVQIGPSLAIGPSSAIGPSLAIAPDLSVGLLTLVRRIADLLSAVPLSVARLSAVLQNGDPSIAVLAAVPLAVLQVALGPRVLELAGPMGPGPTVAILLPPALRAAEIAQAPGP